MPTRTGDEPEKLTDILKAFEEDWAQNPRDYSPAGFAWREHHLGMEVMWAEIRAQEKRDAEETADPASRPPASGKRSTTPAAISKTPSGVTTPVAASSTLTSELAALTRRVERLEERLVPTPMEVEPQPPDTPDVIVDGSGDVIDVDTGEEALHRHYPG